MSDMTLRERVEDVFSERMGLPALDKFRDDPKPFESLKTAAGVGETELLDSLDRVEFIMALEDRFNVEITDADALEIASIAGAVSYLERRGVA